MDSSTYSRTPQYLDKLFYYITRRKVFVGSIYWLHSSGISQVYQTAVAGPSDFGTMHMIVLCDFK